MFRSKLIMLLALVLTVGVPTGTVLAQEAVSTSAQIAEGTAVIWDDTALSDAVTYTLTGVAGPAEGREYVGWLVDDRGGASLSTGPIAISDEGAINHVFDKNSRRYSGLNLIHEFNRVVITDEAEGTDPDSPTGGNVFEYAIPDGAMTHIRHLLSDWESGTNVGILTKLKNQIEIAITSAEAAGSATTLTDVKTHAQRVINIVEGDEGENFSSSATQPGDGLGILAHATGRQHASYAADEAPTDAIIVENAAKAEIAGKNAETSAIAARDAAKKILDQSAINQAKLFTGSMLTHLEQALNGRDADGDGTVDSVEGEGGASNAYVDVQRMATYTLAGEVATVTPPVTVVEPTPPATGDIGILSLAQVSLGASLILLVLGLVTIRSARRSRERV